MNTPIPYLDAVILASTAYPSGLVHSLLSVWRMPTPATRGASRGISTGLLAILVLPYAALAPAVWLIQPKLLLLHVTSVWMFAVAIILVPVALMIEYAIHAFPAYRTTGQFFRGIVIQNPWPGKPSLPDHLLLAAIAIGEEVFFRMIWLGALLALGLPVPLAILISSLAYGLNHLMFGGISVASKTVTGCIYGSLYLLSGQSIWLPIVTHILQNLTLFVVAGRRNA
jgi:membrane protease YdiL (CAAX protease family)